MVVRLNFADRIAIAGERRRNVTTKTVRSAGYVQPENLRGPLFEAIE